MRLTIIPADSVIIKDNHPLICSFQLDNNIHAIQWYDTYGTIEYKQGGATYFEDFSQVENFVSIYNVEEDRIRLEQEAKIFSTIPPEEL